MESTRIDESRADSACARALRCIRKVRSTEHCQTHPCPKLWWGVGQDVPYAPQKKRGGKLQRLASGTSNCHFIFEKMANIRDLLTKEKTDFFWYP